MSWSQVATKSLKGRVTEEHRDLKDGHPKTDQLANGEQENEWSE